MAPIVPWPPTRATRAAREDEGLGLDIVAFALGTFPPTACFVGFGLLAYPFEDGRLFPGARVEHVGLAKAEDHDVRGYFKLHFCSPCIWSTVPETPFGHGPGAVPAWT